MPDDTGAYLPGEMYGGTAWGERFSAQWRDGHLAFHLRDDAPRDTEGVVILSPDDVMLLRALMADEPAVTAPEEVRDA